MAARCRARGAGTMATGRRGLIARPARRWERRRARPRALAAAGAVDVADWDARRRAVEEAGDALGGYQVRPGQVPSSSPDAMRASGSASGGTYNIDEETKLPLEGFTLRSSDSVLLYRDTNSWCPFCERIWIALLEKGVPFETVGIDLRDKPGWYEEMIPTALVPAVRIFPEDDLVYESKDILLRLEERFVGGAYGSLLPPPGDGRARALELMDAFEEEDSVVRRGYKVLLAGRPGGGDGGGDGGGEDARASFADALSALDRTLAERGGPFAMGAEVSLVDIMLVPGLIRLAANLRTFAQFELRFNDAFPHLRRWFAAVDGLASVQRVRSDDETLNAVVGKIFMGGASYAAPPRELMTPPLSPAGKAEAAAKLISNHERVVEDIVRNAGLPDARDAVDAWTRALAATLLGGEGVDLRAGALKESRAAGAAVMMFLRNRVSAPRDMSASAAVAFREGADTIARSIY